MKSFYVYPYQTVSEGARALAQALGGKVIRHEGSRFKPGLGKVVINWGSCHCPVEYSALNPSILTTVTRDKLRTFQKFLQVQAYLSGLAPEALGRPVSEIPGGMVPRMPKWTTSRQEALQALSGGSWKEAVARVSVTGQGGSGIVIKDRDHRDELPDAPLYVEYIPKDSEYRVHVFKDKDGKYYVGDVQRKIKNPDVTDPKDWKVRNYDNGFIFARYKPSPDDVSGASPEGWPKLYKDVCPEDVKKQALLAVACSGLSWSGVDVLWSRKKQQAYILELNSAPGIEGESIALYADYFKKNFG